MRFIPLFLLAPPLAAVPTDGLTAYWDFDGPNVFASPFANSTLASGNADPAMPARLDLEPQGGARLDFDGFTGAAARFDGDGDYLALASPAEVVEDSPFSACTISVRFRADVAPSGSERFFIYETSPTFTLSLGLREDTENTANTLVQFFADEADFSDPNFAYSIPDSQVTGEWVHALVTQSTSQMTGFVNGAVAGSVPITNTLEPFETFHVGTYRNADGRFFDGRIDEIAIWNRLLDGAEIAALAAGPTIVTTLVDEDDGSKDPAAGGGEGTSLREAVNHSLPLVDILFDEDLPDEPIDLMASGLGEIVIDKPLTIDASDRFSPVIVQGGPIGGTDISGGETRCFLVSDGDPGSGIEVVMRNLVIRNGIAPSGDGANILSQEHLSLVDCEVLGGIAFGPTTDNAGGGIHQSGGSLSLSGCRVAGNTVVSDFCAGGGIYCENGDLFLSDSTVEGNLCDAEGSRGGGISINFGALSMEGCTVSNNEARGENATGGGIDSNADLAVRVTQLDNCTLTGNAAPQGIGGAFNNTAGSSTFFHCTLVGNSAMEGGGIASADGSNCSNQLTATVVRDNAGGDLVQVPLGGSVPFSANDSFVGSGNILLVIDNDDGNIVDPTSPLHLMPLGDYGGPTETMLPIPGSPLIDAAQGFPPTDQRGVARTGIPDIGATEFTAEPTDISNDRASVWETDIDADGLAFGIETMLGTDVAVADADSPAAPSFSIDEDGFRVLSFGFDPASEDFASLVVTRSLPGLDNFEAIFAPEGGSPFRVEGVEFEISAESIRVTDTSDAGDSAYYRIEAFPKL